MASAVICWDEVTELTSAELDLNVMHVRGSEKKICQVTIKVTRHYKISTRSGGETEQFPFLSFTYRTH